MQFSNLESQTSQVSAAAQRIGTLQYLRAVAALSVVLYHASYYTEVFTHDHSFLPVFGGGFGAFGVFVFFALSGHLMALQAMRMAGRPALFMVHRLVRIYPIFWIICIIRIIAAVAFRTPLQFDPLVMMLSPVGERDYPLGVEWTLVYEVAFYILVCAIVAARLQRWIGLIGAGWLVAIALRTWFYGLYSPQFLTSLLELPISGVCTAFAAGLALPTLLARRWVGPSALPAGVLLITVSGYSRFGAFSTMLAGLGCTLMVGWAASLIQGVNNSAILGRLGDWSYAIYLVHVPALLSLGILLPGEGSLTMWASMVAFVLLVTPLFGTVDIVVHARLRRAADRWRWKSRACVLAAFAAMFAACMLLSAGQHRREAGAFGSVAVGNGSLIDGLERTGWHEDDRLVGSLDSVVRTGTLTIFSGWVNDPQDVLNRTSMLLLVGDTSVVAVPRSYRLDVIQVFGFAKAMLPTAFKRAIPSAGCPPNLDVRAIVISRRDKAYRMVSLEKCPA